tara:strand:+ start:13951 stop:14598 length:648 start_codon:yes stop_codon:yes gene_type:complete
MKKKVIIYFLTIFFFLFQSKNLYSQVNNSIIMSVGEYPVTRLDLLKEIKLVAILSNTQINAANQEQIKALAIKSLIKRNIKKSEIEKRNINKYNPKQLDALINNTSRKLGVNRDNLKEVLERHGLSFENLVKRFKTDLKWNYMIFQMYRNKISLNTAEIEDKIKLSLENLKDTDDKKSVELIKERIVNEEKEKKLKMFSNLHYSNLERSIQIKFL